MMVPSWWITEIAVSRPSASDATKSSKCEGRSARLAKPTISPRRLTILRANTVVQSPVILLLTGSTITSGVGFPDAKSLKYCRSAIETSGTGQTSVALISFPAAL